MAADDDVSAIGFPCKMAEWYHLAVDAKASAKRQADQLLRCRKLSDAVGFECDMFVRLCAWCQAQGGEDLPIDQCPWMAEQVRLNIEGAMMARMFDLFPKNEDAVAYLKRQWAWFGDKGMRTLMRKIYLYQIRPDNPVSPPLDRLVEIADGLGLLDALKEVVS